MADIKSLDAATQAYFNALPKNVQEQVMQSGVTISSKADLVKFSEHLQGIGGIQN